MRQDVDDRRPAAAGHRPRPVRRRRVGRAVVLLFVAGVLLPVALLAVMWPLTPSVGDAERRIAVRLAAHGGRDPGILPRPDKVGLALIATEDSRFYSHHGLDALGYARAQSGVEDCALGIGGPVAGPRADRA